MPTDINRHRMKACYQPNLLKANLIVIAVIGLLVGGHTLWHRPPDGTQRATTPRMLDSRIMIQDTSQVSHDTTRSAVRSLPSLNPYANRHEKFLGFIRLEPIRIAPEPVVTPPPIYVDEPQIDDIPDLGVVSYALSEGSDTGVFLPETVDIPAYVPPGEDPADRPTPVSRSVRVVYSPKAKVPPIAEMNEKEGYVEVLMLIGVDGKPAYFSCREPDGAPTDGPLFELEVVLKNKQQATLQFYLSDHNTLEYVTVEETPKEYHFAEYLLQVLPEWEFEPAIRDGQPIPSFVLIQYHFCRPSDDDCQELTVSTYPS